MSRTLKEISQNFKEVQASERFTQLQKNMRYVRLMDEMEHNYHTFIMNPTESELEEPVMVLYQEISMARSLE